MKIAGKINRVYDGVILFLFVSLTFLASTYAKNTQVFIQFSKKSKIKVETIVGYRMSIYRMPWETYVPNTSENARDFNRHYYRLGKPTVFGVNSVFGGVNYKPIEILRIISKCYNHCRIVNSQGKSLKKLPPTTSKELLWYIINHENIIRKKIFGGESLWEILFNYVTAKDSIGGGRYEKQTKIQGVETFQGER